MPVFVQELMTKTDFLERKDAAQAGIDFAGQDQPVEGSSIFVVGEMGALETLLTHPEIAQIDIGVIAARAAANDDHPGAVANKHRSGQRVLARVLEHYPGVLALAKYIPDRLEKRTKALNCPAH